MDLATLKILANGLDVTRRFTTIRSVATWSASLLDGDVLKLGVNLLQASVRDRAGNSASAEVSFSLVRDPLVPVVPPPDFVPEIALSIFSGDGQIGLINRCLPEPLVVEAFAGNFFGILAPQAGVALDFSASGGFVMEAAGFSSVTNAEGLAAVRWIMPGTPGAYTLQVELLGDPSVRLTAPFTAQALGVSLQALLKRADVFGAFVVIDETHRLTVRVLDEQGVPVSDTTILLEAGRLGPAGDFMLDPMVARFSPEQAFTAKPGEQIAPGTFVSQVTPLLKGSLLFRVSLPEFPAVAPVLLGLTVEDSRSRQIRIPTGDGPLIVPFQLAPVLGNGDQVVLVNQKAPRSIVFDLRGWRDVFLRALLGATDTTTKVKVSMVISPTFLSPTKAAIELVSPIEAGVKFDVARGLLTAETANPRFEFAVTITEGPLPAVLRYDVGMSKGVLVAVADGEIFESTATADAFQGSVGFGPPEVKFVDAVNFQPVPSLPNQILEDINFADPSGLPAVRAEFRTPKGLLAPAGDLITLDECREPVADDGKFPPVFQKIALSLVSVEEARFDLYRSVPIISTLQSRTTVPADVGIAAAIYHRVDGAIRLQEEGLVFRLDDEKKPGVKIFRLLAPLPIDRAAPDPERVVNGRVNLCEEVPEKIQFRVVPAKEDAQPTTIAFSQSPVMGSTPLGTEFSGRLAIQEFDFRPKTPAVGEYTEGRITITATLQNGQKASDFRSLRTGKPPLNAGVNVWILRRFRRVIKDGKETTEDLDPVASTVRVQDDIVTRANEIWAQACIEFPDPVVHPPVSGRARDGTDLLRQHSADDVTLRKLIVNQDGSSRLDPNKLNIFYVEETHTNEGEVFGYAITRDRSLERLGVPNVAVTVIGRSTRSTVAHEFGHLIGDLQDIKRLFPRIPALDENLMVSPDSEFPFTQFAKQLVEGFSHPDFSSSFSAQNPGPEIVENQVAKSRAGVETLKR